MKRFLLISVMLALTSVLSGCMQDVGDPVLPLEVEETGVPYEIYALSSDTKTVNSGMSTFWEAGDRISVFHAESGSDDYVSDGAFCLTEENISSNLFTGVLAGPLAAGSYDWYFIYPYNAYMTSPAASEGQLVLGSEAGQPQLQIGKDNMCHIAGEAYPMYSVIKDVPADETPSGIMNQMTSLVAVNVINRTSAPMAVKSAGIQADEPVTGKFFVDITEEGAEYIPVDKNSASSSAVLEIADAIVEEGGSAKFYMAVKPFTASSGSRLTVRVNGSEKTIKLAEDVSFAAGKIKTLNVPVCPLVHPVTTMPELSVMFDLDSTCRVDSGFVNGVPVGGFLVLGDETAGGSVTLTGTVADFINMTEFGFFASSWTGNRSALAMKTITIEMSFMGYPADYTITNEQFADFVGLPSSVFVLRPYPSGVFDSITGIHDLTILDEERHYYGFTENEVDYLLSLYGISVEGLRRLFKGEDNSYIEKLKPLIPEHLKAYFTEEMAEVIIPSFKESKISVELSTMTEDTSGKKIDPRVAIWGMNVYYNGD